MSHESEPDSSESFEVLERAVSQGCESNTDPDLGGCVEPSASKGSSLRKFRALSLSLMSLASPKEPRDNLK